MLELVERKTGAGAWPGAATRDGSAGRRGDEQRTRLARLKPPESHWARSSRGLLCSLGCDDYYSPDTVGTWKFHRMSRLRYCPPSGGREALV